MIEEAIKETNEVLTISLFDHLQKEREELMVRREQAQNNLNQLIGAIYAIDLAIKKINDIEKQSTNNVLVN